MNLPLVSVVIPVYNGSNYLKEAIDSALAQTYENIEIIVVNDGSKDDGATERIALSYGDKIRYFSKPNGGVSSALNMGIDNMNGSYFSWLSHDDKYLPAKVEIQIAALQNAEDTTLAVCGVQDIDKNSDLIQVSSRDSGLSTGFHPWQDALNYMLKYGSYNGCSLLIPKKAFDICGKFDETLRYCQDVYMWMKVFLNKFNLIRIEEVGVCNRIHSGQLTQIGRNLLKKDSATIAADIAPQLANSGEYAGMLLYSYAFHNAILGNKETVCICKKEASLLHLFSFNQSIWLFLAAQYGSVRPLIRKLYYKLFRRI